MARCAHFNLSCSKVLRQNIKKPDIAIHKTHIKHCRNRWKTVGVLVHQLSDALLNVMQLLKKLNTTTVQFLETLLILFADVLILPWHTAMYIILPKNSLVIT